MLVPWSKSSGSAVTSVSTSPANVRSGLSCRKYVPLGRSKTTVWLLGASVPRFRKNTSCLVGLKRQCVPELIHKLPPPRPPDYYRRVCGYPTLLRHHTRDPAPPLSSRPAPHSQGLSPPPASPPPTRTLAPPRVGPRTRRSAPNLCSRYLRSPRTALSLPASSPLIVPPSNPSLLISAKLASTDASSSFPPRNNTPSLPEPGIHAYKALQSCATPPDPPWQVWE